MSNNPCHITPEEYFNNLVDLGNRDIGRPIDQTAKTQKFKATLWLCETFPLSLQEQVVPIIDLMSASNAHFKKLKDFITLQIPAGFPIKIGKLTPCIQGSHKLWKSWKTWKIKKKSSMHGKIMELEKN